MPGSDGYNRFLLSSVLSHYYLWVFFLISRLPPRSTLFPYTTLFRSSLRRRRRARTTDAGDRGPCSGRVGVRAGERRLDRKSTRLNSSHMSISYAVFCLKKKKQTGTPGRHYDIRTSVSAVDICT